MASTPDPDGEGGVVGVVGALAYFAAVHGPV